MSIAYECPLCGGSAWARADLARRMETAVRAVADHVRDDAPVGQLFPLAAIRELRACLDVIDGKAPEQLALIGE